MHGGSGLPQASTTDLARLASTFRNCNEVLTFCAHVHDVKEDNCCESCPHNPRRTIVTFAISNRKFQRSVRLCVKINV
jgi:recombinational DNA repair protein RecR